MTRTVKAAFAGPGYHGARQMRAFLAERHELAGCQPDQHTGFVFVRIGEHHGTAHREVVDGCHAQDQRLAVPLAPPVLTADPHLADRERGARQHHEFQEVATLDVQVLRPVDGKILSPGGLCLGRPEVGRDRDLLAVEGRRVEAGRRGSGQPFPVRRVEGRVDRAARIASSVRHIYTSIPAKGSSSTGGPAAGAGVTASILREIARLRGCSSIADTTSTSGARLASVRGSIMYT